ncbi:hypothetical protein WA026_000986 [Henosepilachna vigintioctopunctata]|uniref:Uncharacterized protein n=1 Tax=Henosepilachna vigintioctopunctata TaxID=420089 RepID=A0AAW1UZG6_9CUCU
MFLPESKGRRICAKRDDECVKKAQDVTSVVYGRSINCDCLPSCTELSFTKSGTSSKLHKDSAKKMNYTWEYLRDNINLLHFYFFYTTYGKELKSELHDFTDFLSNTGGLLGVFLGFSILSLVECFYHMLLKFFCSELKNWRKIQQQKNAQTHIHPFIQ